METEVCWFANAIMAAVKKKKQHRVRETTTEKEEYKTSNKGLGDSARTQLRPEFEKVFREVLAKYRGAWKELANKWFFPLAQPPDY